MPAWLEGRYTAKLFEVIVTATAGAALVLVGFFALHGSPEGASIIEFAGLVLAGGAGFLFFRSLRAERLTSGDLRAALDAASIAIAKSDGTITHWSRGCEALYGWSATEALGRKKYALLASRDALSGLPATLDTKAPGEIELVERCKGGAAIHVIERRQPLTAPGQRTRFVLKMLDISDRVRAEQALRDSEARLATAAAAQQIGVSCWDVASGKLEWSEGSEQRLGLPAGGISDVAQWEALVEPEDYRGIMESLAQASKHRAERVSFRYRFRQPDGVLRTVESTASCTYDNAGGLVAVVGANLDITERIAREAALQAREAQLRSIIEAVPSAMVVVDMSGAIVEFSPAAERLWGYSAAAMLGRPVYALAAPEEYERLRGVIERPGSDDNPTTRGSPAAATAIARDGRRLSVEIYYGYARAHSGDLVTLFCRDISERLADERRLNELSAELTHVSRQSAMSELAADLAHELNQPLSATANFLATARMLLEQGGDGARVADLLRMAEEQTLRSGEIIRRLRDFLSKRDVEKRLESVETTIREAVQLVLFGAAHDDIQLTYDLDPAVDMIFADRIQIQQVLVNLLRNAVDALRHQLRDAREIVIASRALEGGLIEIAVSDTGPGLPEEVSTQLYSRFATTKEGTAMGIGLSISRRIVEAHGGVLVAENRAGGGAAFRFTLPVLEEVDE